MAVLVILISACGQGNVLTKANNILTGVELPSFQGDIAAPLLNNLARAINGRVKQDILSRNSRALYFFMMANRFGDLFLQEALFGLFIGVVVRFHHGHQIHVITGRERCYASGTKLSPLRFQVIARNHT